ncbi:MAG: YIP1 family protein [Nitrososphaeria archaeon]
MGSGQEDDSVSLAKRSIDRFLGVIAKPKQTFEGIAQKPVPLMGLLIFGIALALSVGITFYVFSYKIHLSNSLQLPAPDPVGAYGGLVAPGVATADYAAMATQNVTFRLLFLLVVVGVAWLVAQVFKTKQSTFTTMLSAVGYAFAVMILGAAIVTPLSLIYPEQNTQISQVTYEGAVLSEVSLRGTFFHAATTGEPAPILSDLNNSRVNVSRLVSDHLKASEVESILTGLVLENVTVGGLSLKGNITVDKAVLSSIETEDWSGRLAVINASTALTSFGVIRDGKNYTWDQNRALETGDGWSPLLPAPGVVDVLLWFIPLGLRLWVIGLGSVAMYGIYGVGVPTDHSALARAAALLKLIVAPAVIVLVSLLLLPDMLFSPY